MGENLVSNPNFIGDPSDWVGGGTLVGFEFVSGLQPNENNISTALKILVDNNYQIAQQLTLGSTSTYYVRFYVYSESPNVNFRFAIFRFQPTYANIWLNTITSLTQNTWTKYTNSFNLTQNDLLTIQILNNNTPNVVYMTNIYLGTSSSYCFNKGTKILCLKNNEEIYIPIENLQKGDLVKTYLHGYRKIDSLMHSLFKNNINEFTKSMYVMSKQDDMIDDLIITGGHSILVDEYETEEVKNNHKNLFGGELDPIDDKYLLLAGKSSKFKQIQGDDIFDIYHLCLEGETEEHDRRYGIWANGVLTESTYKKIIYNII